MSRGVVALKSLVQYHHMTLMQKQAVQNYWATIRPSGIDIAYCAAVMWLALFVVMLPTMFETYNLVGARRMLETGIGNFVGTVLASVDQWSFTNSIVTFMFWGMIGMVVYAFVSSLIRAMQKAEEERELASDEYVHPADFSRTKFWLEELLESAITFLTFVVFVLVSTFVLLQLLPTVTVHLRSLITSTDNSELLPVVASIALLFIGACIIMLTYKLWRHRQILFEEP